MKKAWPVAIGLALAIAGFGGVRAEEEGRDDPTYPNELPGYRFHAGARWRAVQPLLSDRSEVVAALGTERTTGLSFQDDWTLTVYYVGRGDCDGIQYPSFLTGRVSSIVLVPKARTSFLDVEFSAVFHKVVEGGSHDPVGSWYVYRDETGLAYRVYDEDSENGTIRAGDLKSITYGPSRRTYEAMTGCPWP